MEKDKSRGIKHIKGKSKYKDNTKKNPKYVSPKNKLNLESNWDRYTEESSNKNEKFLTSSKDFGLLSSLPITAGSHFHYKPEEQTNEVGDGELFSLNMDLLNKCILTIPLYERIGMPKDYFSEQEVKDMESEASRNLQSFKQAFAETEHNDVKQDGSEDVESEKVETTDDINDIIENCIIEDSPVIPQPPIDTVSKDKPEDDDLEQWLDDILDD